MAQIKHYRVHGLAIGAEKNTAENADDLLVAIHKGAELNLTLNYPTAQKDITLDEAPLHETITGTRPSDDDINI